MHWQRPLTGIERWHWLFDRAAPMNVVFVARVAGCFDERRLRAALVAVASHYPTLTARIEPADRPLFIPTDEPVPLAVRPWDDGAWRAAAVQEVNTPIPARHGPLMRAVLLAGAQHADLLLSFHQAAVDGLSGATLADEILSLHSGGPRAATIAPEVLHSPLQGALGSRWAAFKTTLRELPRRRRLAPLPAREAVPPERRRTALLDARFPAARTARLARRASAHGSSVHGVLAAALLLAIGKELRGRQHARRYSIGCATPVDLRRRVDLAPALVGNLLSRVVSAHEVHYDTLFWDLAAEVSEALRQATAGGAALAYACMKEAQGIGVSDAALARRVRRAERFNRAAALVNNLGLLETYPLYGDITLQRLGFLVSANAYLGSALALSAVTLADTTCLNFTFAEPLLDGERAQGMVDATLAHLEEAAR